MSEIATEKLGNILGDKFFYSSPIQIIENEMNRRIIEEQENNILKAVYEQGIVVNKDELIKALSYDRGQYQKGFYDGFDTGMESMSRRIVDRLGVLLDLVRTDQQLAVLQAIEIVKEEGGLND